MVIVGRYILTPEVFQYLKKATPSKKGEIILAEVFDKMLSDGKIIYGYELKGEWLECGDKLKWIKSFFYLALKDPRFKDELKQYLKNKIIKDNRHKSRRLFYYLKNYCKMKLI